VHIGILKTKIVFEPSIIIINYCIIIINASYYFSIKGPIEHYDNEENMAVIGAATTSGLKRL